MIFQDSDNLSMKPSFLFLSLMKRGEWTTILILHLFYICTKLFINFSLYKYWFLLSYIYYLFLCNCVYVKLHQTVESDIQSHVSLMRLKGKRLYFLFLSLKNTPHMWGRASNFVICCPSTQSCAKALLSSHIGLWSISCNIFSSTSK